MSAYHSWLLSPNYNEWKELSNLLNTRCFSSQCILHKALTCAVAPNQRLCILIKYEKLMPRLTHLLEPGGLQKAGAHCTQSTVNTIVTGVMIFSDEAILARVETARLLFDSQQGLPEEQVDHAVEARSFALLESATRAARMNSTATLARFAALKAKKDAAAWMAGKDAAGLLVSGTVARCTHPLLTYQPPLLTAWKGLCRPRINGFSVQACMSE